MKIMSDITIRASSLGRFFDCAHSWEGIHHLGMRNAVGRRAILGTAIHAGTAAFDSAKLEGSPISFDDAVGVTMDKLACPEGDFDLNKDDLSRREAEIIGISLTTKYCAEVSPNYEFLAVEMETRPLSIDCGGGISITLTGTMDRARVHQSSQGIGIADIKTGQRSVTNGVASIRSHGPQLGVYELLFEHSSGESITAPAEIIGLKSSTKPEVGIGQISNAKEILLGTEDEPGLLDFVTNNFRAGLFPPNPQSRLCSPKYCPRWEICRFRER